MYVSMLSSFCSGKECYDRWTRFLKPGSRKGQWTEAEDRVVFEAVSNSPEDPFTRWSDLAQQLPGRVGKQVRDRWVNHLNPNINHLPFSKEDDLKLWEGHCALGKRWVEISAKHFNNTRSENHIKVSDSWMFKCSLIPEDTHLMRYLAAFLEPLVQCKF